MFFHLLQEAFCEDSFDGNPSHFVCRKAEACGKYQFLQNSFKQKENAYFYFFYNFAYMNMKKFLIKTFLKIGNFPMALMADEGHEGQHLILAT